MDRRTRTTIPTTQTLLKPRVIEPEKVKAKLKERQKKDKQVYDHHAKSLAEQSAGSW